MNLIKFKDKEYPLFQALGFSARFAFPFALEVCKGSKGYDIGCMKREWAFPGAIPIDTNFNDGYDAYKLPKKNVDYIFSSHCLEHLIDWVKALDYWTTVLRPGGTLFLYLPDYSQEYWRPWNNRKHKHCLFPFMINDYMKDNNYKNICCSETDLNCSFIVFGEKGE